MAIRDVVLIEDIDAARVRLEVAIRDLAIVPIESQSIEHKIEVKKRQLEVQLIDELPNDFAILNGMIDQYNTIRSETTEFGLVLEKLREIYQIKQQIECKYPPDLVSNLLGYREAIHVQLFEDLKQEFAYLGINSMHQDKLRAGLVQLEDVFDETVTFSEILANMSPDKVSLLLEIISAGAGYSKDKFIGLYGDEDTKESRAFTNFIMQNSIEFLGGLNSKNFKITHENGNCCVLKIDNRFNTPKDAEAHLREHSLRDRLTVVHAERQSTYVEHNIPITRSVLVVEYCQNGDLLEHSSQLSLDSDSDSRRIRSALNLYGQMAAALKEIQEDGCVFTDMKNTNWLTDNQGRLRIADTKSFMFTNEEGKIDFTTPANRWYSNFLITKYIRPPKLINESADKLHAFILGKNLYQYLTKCESSSLNNKYDGQHYDFSASIFHSEQGRQLQQLITKLIKPKASERMGVQDALTFLEAMQVNSYKKEHKKCISLLEEIKASSVGVNSVEMDIFVSDMLKKMAETTNEGDLIEIKKIIKEQRNEIALGEVNGAVISAEDGSELSTELAIEIATEVATEIATEIATEVEQPEEIGRKTNKFQQMKRKFNEITSENDLDEDKLFT